MCLTIKTPKGTIFTYLNDCIKRYKQVTKQDMIVYKTLYYKYLHNEGQKWKNQYGSGIVNTKFTSPYCNFEYELGYHYYQEGKDKFTYDYNNSCTEFYVNKGLHAWLSQKTAESRRAGNIVVECIIPKGSEYFKGEYDIVSDNLILVKIVKKHFI